MMGNEVAVPEEGMQIQGMQIQKAAGRSNLSVFADAESFGLACRMADALARSTIVPQSYQGNPSNCLIAIEMASRINTSPMMVMQNLYIVHGTPAWSSQWIIAMINNSKRYKTELKFEMEYGKDGRPVSCMAWAEDYNGNRVVGPRITMEMANAEGWTKKNGSKWLTMPEVMIRYRAASFFGRLNCPDMIMGIYSQEEVVDGFGDPVDEPTAVESEVVPAEDDRKISQEERQMLMKAIADHFEGKDERNGVFAEVLREVGIKSTSNMTVSQLGKALEIVDRIASAKLEGDAEEAGEEVQ